MIKRILSLSAVVLLTASCSIYHINSEEVSTSFYPSKTSASEVDFLDSVSQQHEVLGFITVNTERNKRMQDVIAQMKREAAVMGADAITNITSDATGTWKKVPVQKLFGNAFVRANFTATAVKLTGTPAPAAN